MKKFLSPNDSNGFQACFIHDMTSAQFLLLWLVTCCQWNKYELPNFSKSVESPKSSCDFVGLLIASDQRDFIFDFLYVQPLPQQPMTATMLL